MAGGRAVMGKLLVALDLRGLAARRVAAIGPWGVGKEAPGLGELSRIEHIGNLQQHAFVPEKGTARAGGECMVQNFRLVVSMNSRRVPAHSGRGRASLRRVCRRRC